MKKLLLYFVFFVSGASALLAQTRVITGTVTSSAEGEGTLPAVTVIVKGTAIGTSTDADGKYSLSVPDNATTLVFSFIGMKPQEVPLTGGTVINVVMEPEMVGLEEVVVTALGISREKKSLGYATQEVKGDVISNVKTANFMNNLSGKVSGVQIQRNQNMGGSTNVIVRGSKSLDKQ